jgi:hypothetical protein
MKRRLAVSIIALLAPIAVARTAAAPEGGWEAVDEVFGGSGRDLPGGVRRYGWPRTDLHVTIGEVSIEPALALGSWAAFKKSGDGDAAVAMGDLALLGPEVDPVLRALEAGGLEVLAIHNHLIGETPQVLYVHFHGHGDAAAVAKALKTALGKTNTPTGVKPAAARPTPEQERIFEKLQEALGRNGAMSGVVLQVSAARAEPIQDAGMEVPASMGMSNAMNFQTVGAQVATTGDFVLVANEVNPVIRELHSHGISVTALHSHMLRETPRLFFMHFWGVGSPESIGAGLKSALAKIALR